MVGLLNKALKIPNSNASNNNVNIEDKVEEVFSVKGDIKKRLNDY